MAYQRQSGDDLSDGGFLKSSGWYHLCTTGLDDPVTDSKGSITQGAAFRVHCEVLAGTVDGQAEKPIALTFWEPTPSDKDGGKFRGKIIDRFALAIGVIGADGKNKSYNIDESCVLPPRQFIVHLDHREQRDGSQGKYLEIVGLDIYHVDDPSVASVPKDGEALKLIPAAMRRQYAKKLPALIANAKRENGSQPTNTTVPVQQPQQSAAEQFVL